MAIEPTYADYVGRGHGASECDFSCFLPTAKLDVARIVGAGPVLDEEAFIDAVYAEIDVLANSDAVAGSLSIGSFSISGQPMYVGSAAQAATNAAVGILAPAGMAFQGLA